MLRVAIALVPAIVATTLVFGVRSLVVIVATVCACIVVEGICTRQLNSLLDLSAVVTGLLIALALPPSTPLYVCLVAAVIAIGVAKHLYGGLGNNVFNPAMVGYAAVLLSFPQQLASWDAVSSATALDRLGHRGGQTIDEIWSSAEFGLIGGAGFEWVNLACLIGGIVLIATRVISWRIPTAVILGIGVPAALFYDAGGSASLGSPLFHWFAGGTMLTAFFIATDPVTSPSDKIGQWIVGLFIGAMTFAIRAWGAWPDGFAFAVLFANLLNPLLMRASIARSARTEP